jgi:hypothetical protein
MEFTQGEIDYIRCEAAQRYNLRMLAAKNPSIHVMSNIPDENDSPMEKAIKEEVTKIACNNINTTINSLMKKLDDLIAVNELQMSLNNILNNNKNMPTD